MGVVYGGSPGLTEPCPNQGFHGERFTFRLPEDKAHAERMAALRLAAAPVAFSGGTGGPGGQRVFVLTAEYDKLADYTNELHARLVAVEARAELAAKHFGRANSAHLRAALELLHTTRGRRHHSGDEESGQHDEDCDACVFEGCEAAIEAALEVTR